MKRLKKSAILVHENVTTKQRIRRQLSSDLRSLTYQISLEPSGKSQLENSLRERSQENESGEGHFPVTKRVSASEIDQDA